MRVVDGEARLAGARCPACGHATFPARGRCPACRAETEEAAFGPGAVVESRIDLHVSTEEAEAPYVLGLVRLAEGPVVLARIAGEAAPGAPVSLRADPESDAFWFAPAAEQSDAAPRHAA